MIHRLVLFFFLALAEMAMMPAHAHKPSDSYLSVDANGDRIEGQWDIALRDLDLVLGLDRDNDSRLTWDEIRARHADIAAYALSRLTIDSHGRECALHPTAHLIDTHTDGAYEVLRFQGRCAGAIDTLDIHYRLLFDADPLHRGLLRLRHQGLTQTAVFSPDEPRRQFSLAASHPLSSFAAYLKNGVWHIWIGFDHILFLVSLLLPAVLMRSGGQWRPLDSFRACLMDVLKIVSAFTAAHSITLSLAALGIVILPSRLVESAIAASVIIAALNNVMPLFPHQRWMAAFAFGLIHGFGFASVLTDLGLPPSSLAASLLGFNAGVELGQLAVVGVFLPVAFALRGTVLYRRIVFSGGSALIATVAAVWLMERAFDLKLLPA